MATARYPPLTGGIELHTSEVARRLAAAGIEVTVLTTDLTGKLPAREHRDGVDVMRFRVRPKGGNYVSPAMYRAIVDGQWDLLHVQGFQTLVPPTAMLAALRARLPYVVTFHAGGHSSSFRKAAGAVQEHVLRPLFLRAERLVALTPTEVEDRVERLRLPRERFVVIPNGGDLPRVSAVVRRDPNLIASIGRLERYKGHHHVIAALPHIVKRRPETRLWIAGRGPYESALKQLADELGVAEHVEIRWIPVEDREQMATELAHVSVIVCMSDFESHGIAVLEGIGQGCRAVVAWAPGLAAFIEAGLACGVELADSPENLATAVLEELDQPPLASRPKIPSWDECADALRQLYLAVARDCRPAP